MKTYSLFLLLLLAACHKNETSPATEPKEYFNCYINGKYWTYKQPTFSNHDPLRAWYEASLIPHFALGGDNVVDFPQTGIGFDLDNINFPNKDTFYLSSYPGGNMAHIDNPDTDGNLHEFRTNDTLTGVLIFTKREANLIQGTFYFDAYNETLNRTVHITNGKFSIIPE